MRFSKVFTAILILPLLISSPALADVPVPQITATGEGRIEVVPDMATINLGVVTEGKTAVEAMGANSALMAQVFDYLRAEGIEPRDMQTAGLSISPRSDISPLSGVGVDVIYGYSASNTVLVRVRGLDRVSALLDGAMTAGANAFNGLSFGVQDDAAAMDAARAEAVTDARHRAEVMAAAAGVTLGAVQAITELGGYGMPMQMNEASFSKGGGVPVAGGELVIMVSVSVSFAIAE